MNLDQLVPSWVLFLRLFDPDKNLYLWNGLLLTVRASAIQLSVGYIIIIIIIIIIVWLVL